MFGVREFSADEARKATDDYSDEIGRGGFGVVYKGVFHDLPIAVKKLNKVTLLLLSGAVTA